MNEAPTAAGHVDFLALAAVKTNEQQILETLLRIEVLLTTPETRAAAAAAAKLAEKAGTRRK